MTTRKGLGIVSTDRRGSMHTWSSGRCGLWWSMGCLSSWGLRYRDKAGREARGNIGIESEDKGCSWCFVAAFMGGP